MNTLKIKRENGGIPATLPGEDHISGLIYYLEDTSLPKAASDVTGFSATNRIIAVSSIETAEKLGILPSSDKWDIRNLHYHLSEIFRINPGISLYLGLFAKPSADAYTFTEVKTMQNFSEGRIRQIGIWLGCAELKPDHIVKLQGVADALDDENAPLSILYAPKVANVTSLTNNRAPGRSRVSVVIAQDGDATAKTLFTQGNTANNAVTAIGIFLSLVSLAAVHQSISWVKRFPSGVNIPAFVDGKTYRSLDKAVIESLDNNGYLFLRTYPSIADSYANDSSTMDDHISDYNAIERVRTMDKAVRGIRRNLLPELGGNLYINPGDGKLQPYTIKHLEGVASRHIEDMEKAGELSGYKVYINPEQNVLASSSVEVVIKNVAVGVMRKINIKIGFTDKIK